MTIEAQLDYDQFEALSRVAANLGITVQEAVTRALRDFVQFCDPGNPEPAEAGELEPDDNYYSAERYL